MNNRASSINVDRAIDQALERSGKLHEALASTLDMDGPDVLLIDACGAVVAMTSASLSMEYADSVLVLMARGNPNTATAILRMQLESMVRSAWAMYAATEPEIEALERDLSVDADAKARNVATYGGMLKALGREGCSAPRPLVDEIGRVDQVLRTGLNSFIHGGFQPLKRHGEGFPVTLVLQVIETSNAIATMAAGLWANMVADEGHRLSRLNALILQFRDVLPHIAIVQQRS